MANTLRIYKAPSGQWSGQLLDEDGIELAGVAGCETAEDVEDEAQDAGMVYDTADYEVSQVVPPQKHPKARPQRKGYAASNAVATGESKRSINRSLRRANILGGDLVRLTGTSLDSGVEMDALCKMPEIRRKQFIDRAVAGEKVSAKEWVGDEFYRVNIKSKSLIDLRNMLAAKLAVIDDAIQAEAK